MSYTVNSLVSCENVQIALNEGVFGAASREFIENNPFLDTIISAMNDKGAIQEPMTARGKLKGITVTYFQRLLENDNDIASGNTNDCAGGLELTENHYTYTLTENQGYRIQKSLPLSDLINGCRSDEYYVGKQIMLMINALERKINSDAVTQAASLVGNFPGASGTGTSTAISVNAKNSDGAWVTDLIEDVQYQFLNMGYTGEVIAAGGSELFSKYWSAIGAACCIDKKGIDQGQIANGTRIMPVWDYKINTGLGANKFFAWAPGAIQMLKFNRYAGSEFREMSTATEKWGTIVSPYSGLSFDYHAVYDCETWKFFVGLTYDFVTAPDDMFNSDDRFSGMNLFNQFTAVDNS